MAVFRGWTLQKTRRSISPRGHNPIPTTNWKSHLIWSPMVLMLGLNTGSGCKERINVHWCWRTIRTGHPPHPSTRGRGRGRGRLEILKVMIRMMSRSWIQKMIVSRLWTKLPPQRTMDLCFHRRPKAQQSTGTPAANSSHHFPTIPTISKCYSDSPPNPTVQST